MMHIVSRMILELVRAVNPDLQKGLGAVAQFDGLAGSRGWVDQGRVQSPSRWSMRWQHQVGWRCYSTATMFGMGWIAISVSAHRIEKRTFAGLEKLQSWWWPPTAPDPGRWSLWVVLYTAKFLNQILWLKTIRLVSSCCPSCIFDYAEAFHISCEVSWHALRQSLMGRGLKQNNPWFLGWKN